MLSVSEHRLAIWAEATAWALKRRQHSAAQRLLVLLIDAAAREGCLSVAEFARDRLLEVNGRHHVSRYDSALSAMKNEEFSQFLSSVRRQISFEEAEQMVCARPADDRRTVDERQPIEPQLISWLNEP